MGSLLEWDESSYIQVNAIVHINFNPAVSNLAKRVTCIPMPLSGRSSANELQFSPINLLTRQMRHNWARKLE